MTGRERPILLKKSAMVSTAEKYAFEIEIYILSRGFRAQISRSGAQKKAFSAVSMRAVWKDRLFQQNRPEADIQLLSAYEIGRIRVILKAKRQSEDRIPSL
ncbi:hypothetical protein [Pseudomonas sp. BF-R-30]|jgi:hypothetical protein|uniref:hypothetical protein n=1 Tax=Pseudomonas sp. BF-R-30 TaxID=2832384 RepID=UPI000FA6FCC2|nr:hypothetical protein [Pseudomonas sp. BF-R-30]